MQRLFNIAKWSHIASGKALEFVGTRARKVVLETNSPGRCVLSLLQADRNQFLALVEGRDSVEFYVDGPFWIASTGSDCYIYTADGDGITYKSLEAESYTVVRERRLPNPELDYIARVMSENMNRRLQHQAVELERAFSRRMAAVGAQPAPAPVHVEHGEAPDAAGDREAAGGDEPPAQPGGGNARGRSRSR